MNHDLPETASLIHVLDHSVRELRAQVRRLRLVAIASMLGVILLGLALIAERFANQHLLRTRAIVIEDEDGRDRILIGAPVPASGHRVRTDTERAMAAWSQRFGGESFRESYAKLDHSASGILFLDESGFDRLIVGEHAPDPNTGQRLVDPTGMTWNDDQGFELGGIGCSKTEDGRFRVVMGMDDPSVGEALHLFVLEDGTKGLRIASEDALLLLGRARANNEIFGNTSEFAGFLVKDVGGNVVLEQNALKR